MCSILFSTKKSDNIEELNYFLKFRGPDFTNVKLINDNLFIHNLLSITGDFKPQPFEDNGIVLIYNGEIYNYREFGDFASDGECLIPLYKKYGFEFISKLDGEFAICLVDYIKKILIISSDIFKTKPLYLALDPDGIACSTYKTPLEILGFKNVQKFTPNTIKVIDLNTFTIIHEKNIYEFDLNQYKLNYDDWILAFKNSINKRIHNTDKNIFIGLSSGYDSGIIYSELLKNDIDFYTFSLLGTENEEIIRDRISRKTSKSKCFFSYKNTEDYNESHNYIKNNTETFYYTINSSSSNYNEYNTLLINDGGSNHFGIICKLAKKHGCKICLSGTGADEIISDYGYNGKKMYPHSNFGGQFPEDLKTIFPWASFYGSTLESYIAKEEYVGGSFGIEVRYPFLDKEVVQEFLWLHHDLKNKEYKSPIDYYFRLTNFPFEKGNKLGF